MYQNPNLPSTLYQLIAPKSGPKITILDTEKSTSDDNVGTTAIQVSLLLPLDLGYILQCLVPPPLLRTQLWVPPYKTFSLILKLKLWTLMGSVLGDDNMLICLSFHIPDDCFSSCYWKEYHVKSLFSAKKQNLSYWVMVDQTA
jgi:hypothetical protein